MFSRVRFHSLILLVAVAVTTLALRSIAAGDLPVARPFPPPKPSPMPAFHVPVPGERLDDEWLFMQELFDADTTYPHLFNAYPVGMAFTRGGRGVLATLHTIFLTQNGGRSWRNLDPYPPPRNFENTYRRLRAPTYLSDVEALPALTDNIVYDKFYFTTLNSGAEHGTVRSLYYSISQGYLLYQDSLLTTPMWLNGVVAPDTGYAYALGGLDGGVFRGDSSIWPYGFERWQGLDPDKILIRDGRNDTLDFHETWVSDVTSAGSLIIAVGSYHWVSRDGGDRWRILPAADSLGDAAVSFCDTLHGLVGGGRTRPAREGWVHRTSDGGRTWSGRILSTDLPIHSVLMVTPEIGFAAGGDYQQAAGGIWRTTDGGGTWIRDLTTDAEFRELVALRFSAAYVDVVAAGVFPDFRGGVWMTRLFVPADTMRAILLAIPDTLNFGAVPPGVRDTLSVVLTNVGHAADTIIAIRGGGGIFYPTSLLFDEILLPADSLRFDVVFVPPDAGSYRTSLVVRARTDSVEVFCRGETPSPANDGPLTPVPQHLSLSVRPNPANAAFEILFDLPRTGFASITAYDLAGRIVGTVARGVWAAGRHEIVWNAQGLPSGVYFLRLETADGPLTTKLLLLK